MALPALGRALRRLEEQEADGQRMVALPLTEGDTFRRLADVPPHVPQVPVARLLDVGHGQMQVVERLGELRLRRRAHGRTRSATHNSRQRAAGGRQRAVGMGSEPVDASQRACTT